MTEQPHALISGAGIAGTALAQQLTTYGWRTTVVERSPELREGGQNVDIRGAARKVAHRMGILDDVVAASTGEVGMRFLRQDGSVAASFPVSRSGRSDGPTAELEILRGELSRILYQRSRGESDYRFGTCIADCTDHGDYVTTVLDDQTSIDADVVVIAEGLRSQSRTLVTSAEVSDLGMYFAYLTLERRDTDDRWWNWMQAPGHRAVHLRPDNRGTTRALLTFISDVRGLETLNRADQISVLRRTFADVRGPAPRVLAELDGAPMYFDAAGQFRSPTWHKGRVALLGDSAFCNATFGGAGTSLALIGAYVLAGELSNTSDHPAALQRYERHMGPITDTAPPVRMGVVRLANPRTSVGIRTLHSGARLLASRPVQAAINAAGRRLVSVTDDVALPNYGPAVDSSRHVYLAPSWWEKKVSGLFARANIAERLTVTGRISGNPRHVAVNTIDVDGTKYVVSARGESQWVKNVRVNPEVSLTVKGRTTAYTATEVPADRRAPIVSAKFGRPGVGRFSAMLPDDADHPTFELRPKPLPRNSS